MTTILALDGDPCQGPILAKILQIGGHSVVHETSLGDVDQYLGTFQLAVVAVDNLDGEPRGILAQREFRAKIRTGLRCDTPGYVSIRVGFS